MIVVMLRLSKHPRGTIVADGSTGSCFDKLSMTKNGEA
jgi:hypothetical protein